MLYLTSLLSSTSCCRPWSRAYLSAIALANAFLVIPNGFSRCLGSRYCTYITEVPPIEVSRDIQHHGEADQNRVCMSALHPTNKPVSLTQLQQKSPFFGSRKRDHRCGVLDRLIMGRRLDLGHLIIMLEGIGHLVLCRGVRKRQRPFEPYMTSSQPVRCLTSIRT